MAQKILFGTLASVNLNTLFSKCNNQGPIRGRLEKNSAALKVLKVCLKPVRNPSLINLLLNEISIGKLIAPIRNDTQRICSNPINHFISRESSQYIQLWLILNFAIVAIVLYGKIASYQQLPIEYIFCQVLHLLESWKH